MIISNGRLTKALQAHSCGIYKDRELEDMIDILSVVVEYLKLFKDCEILRRDIEYVQLPRIRNFLENRKRNATKNR